MHIEALAEIGQLESIPIQYSRTQNKVLDSFSSYDVQPDREVDAKIANSNFS